MKFKADMPGEARASAGAIVFHVDEIRRWEVTGWPYLPRVGEETVDSAGNRYVVIEVVYGMQGAPHLALAPVRSR